MLSNRLLTLSLLSLIALAGCSLRLNDPVEKTNVNVSVGCLTGAGEKINAFAEGRASAAELDGFWNCAEKAFNTFYSHTEGSTTDAYKPEELGSFLSKYFLKGKPVPAGLMHEAMVLKQAVFGGRSDRLTKNELLSLLRVIKVGRRITMRLRPHMPIRHEQFVARRYSGEQFEEALAAFQEGMALLGETLKNSHGTYLVDNQDALLRELKEFLYPENDGKTHWVDNLTRWSRAMRPAKALFVAPPKDEIRPGDWQIVYRMAPRYYALYLRARFYGGGDANLFRGPGLRFTEQLFAEFGELFRLALEAQPNQEIPSEAVDELIDAMGETGLLPGDLKPATLRAFTRVLFGKILGSAANDSYRINAQTLQQLSQHFYFGTEGLRAVEALARHHLNDERAFTGFVRVADAKKTPRSKLIEATAFQNELSEEAVDAVLKTVGDVRTIFPEGGAHVYIPDGMATAPLTFHHMTRLHLLRTLNRLLMQTYGKPGATELREKEFYAAVDDLFPIIRELGFADEETRLGLKDRLREASLFLPSSDGRQDLTMAEALELEALLWSAVSRAGVVHAKLATVCPTVGEDAKKRPHLEIKCVLNQFRKNGGDVWSYVPGFAAYFKGLSERDREALVDRFNRFLRKKEPAGGAFRQGNAQAFVLFPYYVELLFHRFDKNENGKLENAEADAAYPVFRPFLAEMAAKKGLTENQDHKALFAYIIKYRAIPSKENLGDLITYGWHRYVYGDPTFAADRGQVVEIFQLLIMLAK